MKPRIFKSGVYWVAEYQGLKYCFFWWDQAVRAALLQFRHSTPLAAWVAATLEPSHV